MHGKHQTRSQAARTNSEAITRLALKRQRGVNIGSGPIGQARPRRESLGMESTGPINPRIRPVIGE